MVSLDKPEPALRNPPFRVVFPSPVLETPGTLFIQGGISPLAKYGLIKLFIFSREHLMSLRTLVLGLPPRTAVPFRFRKASGGSRRIGEHTANALLEAGLFPTAS